MIRFSNLLYFSNFEAQSLSRHGQQAESLIYPGPMVTPWETIKQQPMATPWETIKQQPMEAPWENKQNCGLSHKV
jgi:hypothetical protein